MLPELLFAVEAEEERGTHKDKVKELEAALLRSDAKEGSPVWRCTERRALFKGGGVNPPSDSLSPDEARLTSVHVKESSLFHKGTRLLVLFNQNREVCGTVSRAMSSP